MSTMATNAESPFDLDVLTDQQHREVLAMLPPDFLNLDDIPAARARLAGFFETMPAPELPAAVAISEQMVAGRDANPDVRVKVYRPETSADNPAVIVWIHGGGMVLLDADNDDLRCAELALRLGCPVVSVDYRLAPESPAPAAVLDCAAGLQWASDNAADLGVKDRRVIIAGASAGAGLAAGTALYVRDHGGPDLLAQLLTYPMLDHRNVTQSSERIVDERVWSRSANLSAWRAYLGGADPSPYASPTVADDLSGLPPAYINVGTLDLFLDECVDYATRLNAAGVSCDLRVYAGAFHASNVLCAHTPVSQRWAADEDAFLADVLAGEL